MAKLSKKPLDPKKLSQFIRMFYQIIDELPNVYAVEAFFGDLLTHTEIKMLSKRLQIALLLVQGVRYEDICEEVKVSATTVAAVNNYLNTGATQLREMLESILPEKEEEKIQTNEEERRTGYYMAGDLLLPFLDDGFRYLRRKIRESKAKHGIYK